MTTTFNDTCKIKFPIGHNGMSTVYLAGHKRHQHIKRKEEKNQ